MLVSAIRVLARAAAIQVEEVAATHAVHQPRSAYKGKEREVFDLGTEPRDGLDRGALSHSAAPAATSSTLTNDLDPNATEEKSEDVLEVERKIAKLLERAKQREKQAAVASSAASSASTPAMPLQQAPLSAEQKSIKDAQRLPENARAPKTIQGHTTPSKPASPPGISSSLPLPESARVPRTIQPRSTPPATSQHPVAPQQETEAPPTADTTSPIASSSTSTTPTPMAHPTPAEASASTQNERVQSEILDALEQIPEEEAPVMLRASKVPSSRIGRLFHYGSLAASLSLGAASESIRRSTGRGGTGSVFMSDANVRRLVATLGRMRGAALKLGQFMSIQDNHMLPPEIEKVLQQVQAHANYMPDWQMEKVMSEELGPEWESLFSSFERTPIASASIGQVHRATLSSGETVAVKIQFPGIKESIASDLGNLSLLLRSSALLPPGLYLQNTIAVMSRELEDECDYVREGESGTRFHEMLADDDFFVVPKVFEQATRGRVLTSEWMTGKPLSRMQGMSQATRDKIGANILRLCLQELFEFRFMQTDPNWANFLYDQKNDKIQLIDFGASREYTKEFMDGWFRLLKAALEGDRGVMKAESESLGYLTGEENDEMLQAHLDSMALVASPFAHAGAYDFTHQTITDSVRALIPIMLKHRLTPPPSETYSLNRKLSGAFLMCARLGARVHCGQLWKEHVAGYKEG